jgi:RNA 3'-terminal phosphate cyclase (ATP)
MIEIDGSEGEGGGQVLRTALALSLVTGQGFAISGIRARRRRPGLLQQHLTATRAAASVGSAQVAGATIGSDRLEFVPGPVAPGEHYSFAVGTAGSATLVLQTVIPALIVASGPSRLVLEGGTHNAWAPPFDFLAKTFVPVLSRMGPRISLHLERHGFYPAGGGRFAVEIIPTPKLVPLELCDRGAIVERRARGIVARLPRSIAEVETAVLTRRLRWPESAVETAEVPSSGPGNVVMAEVTSEHICEVFTGFGMKGIPGRRIAEGLADEVQAYLEAEVPVGPYLADQLMIPLAMAGGGRFRTLTPTLHTTTNAGVIARFLPVVIEIEPDGEGHSVVTVTGTR